MSNFVTNNVHALIAYFESRKQQKTQTQTQNIVNGRSSLTVDLFRICSQLYLAL